MKIAPIIHALIEARAMLAHLGSTEAATPWALLSDEARERFMSSARRSVEAVLLGAVQAGISESP